MSALNLIRIPAEHDATSIILKLVGESCNLDCTYCYEKRKPYAGSRVLSPQTVEKALEHLAPKRLAIELHGGEPLLYPGSHFERLSKIIADYSGEVVRVSMQTNGTLLDRRFCADLLRWFPQLQLGVSCDGPPDINKERVFYSGASSATEVEATLRILGKIGIHVGVICVVSRGNISSPEMLMQYFSGFDNVKAVKFVPCFDEGATQAKGPRRRSEIHSLFDDANGSLPWSIRPDEYTIFLSRAFDAWINCGYFNSFIAEPFVTMIRKIKGVSTNNCHFEPNKCGHVFTLYPDSTLGSCDELDRNEAQYGSIEIPESLKTPATIFRAEADPIIAALGRACVTCSHQTTCGGGCIATRKRMAKNGSDHLYCVHRRATLDHIERNLTKWEQG